MGTKPHVLRPIQAEHALFKNMSEVCEETGRIQPFFFWEYSIELLTNSLQFFTNQLTNNKSNRNS